MEAGDNAKLLTGTSDAQLAEALRQFSVEFGPIIESTREVYRRKLARLVASHTGCAAGDYSARGVLVGNGTTTNTTTATGVIDISDAARDHSIENCGPGEESFISASADIRGIMDKSSQGIGNKLSGINGATSQNVSRISSTQQWSTKKSDMPDHDYAKSASAEQSLRRSPTESSRPTTGGFETPAAVKPSDANYSGVAQGNGKTSAVVRQPTEDRVEPDNRAAEYSGEVKRDEDYSGYYYSGGNSFYSNSYYNMSLARPPLHPEMNNSEVSYHDTSNSFEYTSLSDHYYNSSARQRDKSRKSGSKEKSQSKHGFPRGEFYPYMFRVLVALIILFGTLMILALASLK